jgi:hypothetical protein
MTADSQIRGADRVREVFARVRQGDLTVADLYAEDAVLIHGREGRVEGREAIRAFYQRTIEGIHPQPQVEDVLERPPRYVAIVDVPTTDGHRRALDLFEVDDEGIRRLEIYSQG